MARSDRTFTLASKADLDEAKEDYEPIEFTFDDPDAQPEKVEGSRTPKKPAPRVCIARYPGDGAMIVMAASVGMSDAELSNPAGALFEFLAAVFDSADYQFIRRQVRMSRLDLRGQVMSMVSEMMEEWSGVPTQQ